MLYSKLFNLSTKRLTTRPVVNFEATAPNHDDFLQNMVIRIYRGHPRHQSKVEQHLQNNQNLPVINFIF